MTCADFSAGAKGMIALDSRLQHDSLFLRESMIKFPGSDSTDIEICGAAYRPLPLYLNQQSIKILEDMGVQDDFFFHHQTKEINRLRSTLSSSANASKFLKGKAVGDVIHLPWFINKLSTLNIPFQNDHFLRDILELAVLVELRALKYKARIPVKEGYNLYGIMDETGILEEGQIFCIVDSGAHPKVITGRDLLITRAPALHPGDIQLVDAVSVPSNSPLMQLRNCICFSQKGARDLPSKLSGGDLDGDLFQLILDPKARPRKVFSPADYPAARVIDLGRAIDRDDMTDFFITFMATDQLGRISNLHKILADQRELGVADPDCLRLANMASIAVDFSKSGIPVSISFVPPKNKTLHTITLLMNADHFNCTTGRYLPDPPPKPLPPRLHGPGPAHRRPERQAPFV
jgi:RNA dependent RNA polymerase